MKTKILMVLFLFIFNINSMYYTLWANFTKCKFCPLDGPFKFDEPYDRKRIFENPFWLKLEVFLSINGYLVHYALKEYDLAVQTKQTANVHQRDHLAAAIAAISYRYSIQRNPDYIAIIPYLNELAFKIAKNKDYELLKFLLKNIPEVSIKNYTDRITGNLPKKQLNHNTIIEDLKYLFN
ncbi:hypothetical protein M1446_00410 [Candidatus Dependentiae bacterium]|nr:hypothetical protein [Candidatus Dependentiae bacterium]